TLRYLLTGRDADTAGAKHPDRARDGETPFGTSDGAAGQHWRTSVGPGHDVAAGTCSGFFGRLRGPGKAGLVMQPWSCSPGDAAVPMQPWRCSSGDAGVGRLRR